jgi:hypothetical protein
MSSEEGGVGMLSSSSGRCRRLRSSESRWTGLGGGAADASFAALTGFAALAAGGALVTGGAVRLARLGRAGAGACLADLARVAAFRRGFAGLAARRVRAFLVELDRAAAERRAGPFEEPRFARVRAGRLLAFLAMTV